MIIYLAGPLFTLAERRFNEEFATALEGSYIPARVILPQRYAAEISTAPDFAQRMFGYSLDVIDSCDAVVAILDGADADSGTCIEIGYARGKNKVVVGVRTDFRACEDRGLNLMVANVCSRLILRPNTACAIERLAEEVVEALVACTAAFAQSPSSRSLRLDGAQKAEKRLESTAGPVSSREMQR